MLLQCSRTGRAERERKLGLACRGHSACRSLLTLQWSFTPQLSATLLSRLSPRTGLYQQKRISPSSSSCSTPTFDPAQICFLPPESAPSDWSLSATFTEGKEDLSLSRKVKKLWIIIHDSLSPTGPRMLSSVTTTQDK